MADIHDNVQSHSGARMSVTYEAPKLTYLGHIFEVVKTMPMSAREMLNNYWRAKRSQWLDHKKDCVECLMLKYRFVASMSCETGRQLFNDMETAARRAIQGG